MKTISISESQRQMLIDQQLNEIERLEAKIVECRNLIEELNSAQESKKRKRRKYNWKETILNYLSNNSPNKFSKEQILRGLIYQNSDLYEAEDTKSLIKSISATLSTLKSEGLILSEDSGSGYLWSCLPKNNVDDDLVF